MLQAEKVKLYSHVERTDGHVEIFRPVLDHFYEGLRVVLHEVADAVETQHPRGPEVTPRVLRGEPHLLPIRAH